jgi:hypothetical protein
LSVKKKTDPRDLFLKGVFMKLTSLLAVIVMAISLSAFSQSATTTTSPDTMGTNSNMGKSGEMNAAGVHHEGHKKGKHHSMKHGKKAKKY